MNKKYILFLLFSLLISSKNFSQIYVAPDGNDSNPGTYDLPKQNITTAINIAQPGDTIYLRGGTYSLTATIRISKDGNESNRYYLVSYQNERALLDFSSMATSSSNRGINLSGDYWYIKEIDIKGAGDNGMNISGNNNLIEFCSFFENRDTGLQLGGGASNNNIINCDSYFNADPSQGNADGFAPKLDVGINNYFYGCRAWQNSDDGWDGYMRGADEASTIVENSWCFANGYLKNGNPSNGNGNGYKMGGGDNGNSDNLSHDFTLINSLAFDNRVKGFDQNNNRGSMTLYNCSAYRNGTNYSLPSVINSDETATIINSLALGSRGSIAAHVIQQTNSWLAPFNVTNEDFISIDTTGVRGPRKPDGSLPDIDFLHLADGSDLINAGTDIGLPFAGSAPDLGAFEKGLVVPVELLSFSALVSTNEVLLKWSTVTEINNLGFEIEKKINNQFVLIGFVKGAGTSTETKNYTFSDRNLLKGINTYRLKQIDYDGRFEYSEEISVNLNNLLKFELSQNYPNPFNPSTRINFTISKDAFISLIIYNMLGEEVSVLIDNEFKEAGFHSVDFNAIQAGILSSGTYLYVIKQGENILSKKMTLIK